MTLATEQEKWLRSDMVSSKARRAIFSARDRGRGLRLPGRVHAHSVTDSESELCSVSNVNHDRWRVEGNLNLVVCSSKFVPTRLVQNTASEDLSSKLDEVTANWEWLSGSGIQVQLQFLCAEG